MNKLVTKSKIRVGVLMGGRSIEREVSFNSGRTICDHLDTTKYEIVPIFQIETGELFILPWHFLHRGKISDFFLRLEKEAKKIYWDDLKNLIDFVYIALHGRYGEDGTIQGFLSVLKIPFLGAKVYGSALGMNKLIQKRILKASGIKVANDVVIKAYQIDSLNIDNLLTQLSGAHINFPCIAKPVHEGSSLGISVVKQKEDLINAIKNAANCDERRVQDVLIEEKLEGMEFVCVSLKRNGQAIPDSSDWFALSVTEVVKETGTDFYDYIQKYMPGRATKITPARCNKKDYENILQECLKVTKILEFSTISRIDGYLTKSGDIVIIDPNSLTGMGPATFLFHQAAEVGMNHSQLINYLIETELQQYGLTGVLSKEREENNNMHKIVDKKIKVAVLLGGNTNEREISLETGRNICYKLSPHKYEAIPVFVNDEMELFKLSTKLLLQNSTREISDLVTKDIQIKWTDLPTICDFVFIGLHGGFGENGAVQGTLEMLDLPYNGSGVLTSALCMDKKKTTDFLKSQGFDLPESVLLEKTIWQKVSSNKKDAEIFLNNLIGEIKYPVILKPHDDGCSVFVTKAKSNKELIEKLNQYFAESGKNFAMIEEFIKAVELTCGVIGNDKVIALPASKVLANKEILSIEEKFLPGEGENLTPAPIPQSGLKLAREVMERAYRALDCKGYVRIDCFYQEAKDSPTGKERIIILEVNTLPGMTPATCIFHQAAEVGLKPMDFIDKIIEFGFENHKEKLLSKNKKINIQQADIKQL